MSELLSRRKVKSRYWFVNKNALGGIIILLVLLVDQVSKNVAGNHFLTTCNGGIAFGIKTNVTILAFVLLTLVLWVYLKEKKLFSALGFSLIFAGGISNLVDRVSFGCVRDFISIYNFPSFNFADSAITIGCGIIAFNIIILHGDA